MPDNHATYYREDYAYPCDTYINVLLSSFLVRKTLQKVAEKHYSEESEKIYQDSTLVNTQTYPQLYSIYQTCIERLHISSQWPLYVTNQLTGINALSIELSGKQMILISRQAVAQLSENELLFILGHEMGHCQYGHIVCHTVIGLISDMNKTNEIIGQPVTDIFDVKLAEWFHCSEYTADRAGLICCESIQTAYDIFCKLGMNNKVDALTQLEEVSSPHPLLQTRWEMLQKYIDIINTRLP